MIESAEPPNDKVPPQIPLQDLNPTGFIISKAEQDAIIARLNASPESTVLQKGTTFPEGPLQGTKSSFTAIKDEIGNIIVLHDKAVLGKGAFGSVIVGQAIQSGDPRMQVGDFCAVKMQMLKKPKDALKVKKEDDIGKIMDLNYSSFAGGKIYYSVMPLLQGEMLSKALPTYYGKFKKDEIPEGTLDNPADFNVPYFISLFLRMTDAVAKVHNQGIIHLDIKPDNMMMDASGRVTLIDFGTSKLNSEQLGSPSEDAIGTPYFMASEYFSEEYKGQLSTKQDIYSLARTFELAMYGNLFKLDPTLYETRAQSPMLNEYPMYSSSYLKDLRIPNPNNSPDITAINDLIEVVQVMRTSDPDSRPEARAIFGRLQAINENYEQNIKAKAGYSNQMLEATAFVKQLLNTLKEIRGEKTKDQMRGITPMFQQHNSRSELTVVRELLFEIDKVKDELKGGRYLDASAAYSKVSNVIKQHANENGTRTEKLCHQAMTDIQQRMEVTERSKLHAK